MDPFKMRMVKNRSRKFAESNIIVKFTQLILLQIPMIYKVDNLVQRFKESY